jgi:TRAP-type transport system small permease protein
MEEKAVKVTAPQVPITGLGKLVSYLSKVVDPLTGVAGVAVAGTMLTAMMLLTFFDVAGRRLLNRPIIGSWELIEFMMALLVTFGLGYCALKKGHIRVDLIMQYTGRKTNLWFDIFAYGISCVFFMFISWRVWLHAQKVYASNLTSPALFIPVYPFIFLLSVGAALVALVFLRDFLKSVEEVGQ